jgi:hypothetical protein
MIHPFIFVIVVVAALWGVVLAMLAEARRQPTPWIAIIGGGLVVGVVGYLLFGR